MGMYNSFVLLNKEIDENVAFSINYLESDDIEIVDANGWYSIHDEVMWLFDNYDFKAYDFDDDYFLLIPKKKVKSLHRMITQRIIENLENREYNKVNAYALEIVDSVIEKMDDFDYIYYEYNF